MKHCFIPNMEASLLTEGLMYGQSARGYPNCIPFGWYFVAYVDELTIGDVKTVHCFNQEWVLFRNEAGDAGMLAPYCPHLGAHLGIGGCVDGTLLRCPFHAWGFDRQGYCRSIPYAKKFPKTLENRTVLQSLPVVEFDQMIWAWYHPQQRAPLWEASSLLNMELSQMSTLRKFSFEVKTSVQDITENSVDIAHLKVVHGHTADFACSNQYNGIFRNTVLRADYQLKMPDGNFQPAIYTIHLQQKGPGQQLVRYHRLVELFMMYLVTPVTPEKTIIHFALTHPDYQTGSVESQLVHALLLEKIGQHGDLNGIAADLPIWNNKIYRAKPQLCDGDSSIMPFRAWFKQFYG